jgi:hypothetical protein
LQARPARDDQVGGRGNNCPDPGGGKVTPPKDYHAFDI